MDNTAIAVSAHTLVVYTDASIRRAGSDDSWTEDAGCAGMGLAYFLPHTGWQGEYATLGWRHCSNGAEIEGMSTLR